MQSIPVVQDDGTTDCTVLQFRDPGQGCLSYAVASGSDGILIDPTFSPETYARALEAYGAKLTLALYTHAHEHDAASVGALPLAGPAEAVERAGGRVLRDGEHVTVGRVVLSALAAPGHTEGSLVYLLGPLVFAGDALRARAAPCDGTGMHHAAPAEAERTARMLLRGLIGRANVLPAHCCDPHRLQTGAPIMATVGDLQAGR